MENLQEAKEIFSEFRATLNGKGKERLSLPYLKELREKLYRLGYIIAYGKNGLPGDDLILAKIVEIIPS